MTSVFVQAPRSYNLCDCRTGINGRRSISVRRITRLPLALLSEAHPLYTLSCSWRSWWYMIALPPAVQSSTTAVRPAFHRDEKPASFRHFGRRVGRLPGEPPHKRGGAPKAPIGRVRGSPLWLIFCADARVGGWEGLPSLVAGGGERLTLPLFGNDGRRRHQSPFRGVAPVNAQATPHIFYCLCNTTAKASPPDSRFRYRRIIPGPPFVPS